MTWRKFQPKPLTISYDAQYGQIHQAFPVGPFLQGNTVTRGGEDVTAADGDQLAAVISARHVVQDRGIVNESIQLPVREPRMFQGYCLEDRFSRRPQPC